MPSPYPALAAGDHVEVTLGAEQFGGFTVGPVSGRTAVRDGESPDRAAARLAAFLEALFEAQFQTKALQHAARRAELDK